MKLAVLQSNYLPWKGYFDIINDVDLFLFYDDVQYTKRDWRNRNRLVTEGSVKWMSVPVGEDTRRLVVDVRIPDHEWQKAHYDMIEGAYRRAPFFETYQPFLQHVYFEREWTYLYELNRYLIEHIAHDFLGVTTRFGDTRDYAGGGVKHERLLNIVKATGADLYESGPAARDYIIAEDYQKAGIELVWKDYSGYPEYPQQFGRPFEHGVSILDVLFNTGDEAPYYIWGWRK